MKKYDAYKPSGIEWIGEVPEEWEKCRFKNFVTLINRPTSGGNKIGLENIESGSGKFSPSDSEFDGDGVGFVVGDIVYGKLRPYLMKVWVAEFQGNAVGDFFVFRVKDNADSSFVKYLMLSDGFTKEANGATEGAKMPRVSSDFILTLRYYLPSKEDQSAIADYLDAKCAKIDNVVAVQQKRIELLKELKQSIITHAVTKGLDKNAKMKDSGIEWIGEVPSNWNVARLKFLFSRSIAGVWGEEEKGNNDDIVCFRVADFDYNRGCLIVDDNTIRNIDGKSLNGRTVKRNDLLIEKSGGGDAAPVGRVVRVNTDIKATCSNFIHIVTIADGNDSTYIYYYFKYLYSNKINTLFFNQTTGIQNLKVSSYLGQMFYLPPLLEQTAIADYLDKKCAIIDRQIAKVEKQIELLNEYKQSVITECVTGKRKVC